MLLFALLCCLSYPEALPPADSAAPDSVSADPALPDGAGSHWLGIVQARIAAEGRAINKRGGAFAADLPGLGLEARFDAERVVISGEEGEVLSLRTLAWGRPRALFPLDAREPAMGDCTAALDAAGHCIRRLEYADRELTEWWVGLGTGLEQGWTVEAAPGGEGLLVVEVAVEGALSIEGGGEEATITDAEGRAWNVGRIAAWDAEGEPLPARVVATEEGLRVEVDDAGAAYPVEIDPVYTTAAWTVGSDDAAVGDPLGYSVSGAGDVNGDGYDDVVVGAPFYSSGTGRAHLYHGSSSGLESTASTTLTGKNIDDNYGGTVSGAGDVNGDGYDDVIVGVWRCRCYASLAHVYLGSSSGLGSTVSTNLTGESTDIELGIAVSGAGDVNGDGYDDVVVGARLDIDGSGRAYVYHGSSSGLGSTAITTLIREATDHDYFGRAVSGAGDVNGDGYDDVVVGAYGYSSTTGRVHVYHGSSSGLESTAVTTLTGGNIDNYFGLAVSGAGDVNGDGYDDVVVGAYGYSSYTGRAYVYHGSSGGLGSSARTALTGEGEDNRFGWAVSGAGDVNGDGYDDVVVGAYGYSWYDGRAYVYLGTSSGLGSSASTTLTGEDSLSELGWAVSGAGDVNGDGYDDVLVGAPRYSDWSGRSYLYQGSSSGLVTAAITTLTGESTDVSLGIAVSGAGDVNGDGYDDVVVGAPVWSTGRAYLYHGSSSGLVTTANTTLTGESDYHYFGYAVSGAGDVNGDGYDDVVVGAYGYSWYTGCAYVYLGSSSGLGSSASTMLTEESTSPYFGLAVSGAGDVNGDGYDDVIVGAPDYLYLVSTGRAYVYPGSASGLGSSAITTLTGESADSKFGDAVSGAGDVNGDGYDDVVIGAPDYLRSAGRAYVYQGSSSGLGSTASTTLTGESPANYFGLAVSGAGDVNGDGYDDVVVGAYGYSGSYGRAYVYLGTSSGLGSTATTTLTGECTDNFFGSAVSDAGDVNGDGYDDVVVGAYRYNLSTGRAYVYHGSSSGMGSSASTRLTGESRDSQFGYAVSGAGDVNGDGYDDVVVGAPEVNTGYLYLGYADLDGDGDGIPADRDCDDTDASIGEPTDIAYADADADGYGSGSAETVCPGATGYAAAEGDCDDGNAARNPGAEELCNGVDDSCDGSVDEDPTDASTWYADADGDGYTDPERSLVSCDQPEGYAAATEEDCDDDDPGSFPGAAEVPDDGVDQDCNGDDLVAHGGDHTGRDKASGRGCQAGGGGGSLAAFGLLIVAVLRRRAAWT